MRAEQARPRDGAIKGGTGVAIVHMENPTRALDFRRAQLLGAPNACFWPTALARDLLGRQDAAQRDYQLALSVTPATTTRRYALRWGSAASRSRSQLLTPQLRAQDRGAWRLRAMILAMNGRVRSDRDRQCDDAPRWRKISRPICWMDGSIPRSRRLRRISDAFDRTVRTESQPVRSQRRPPPAPVAAGKRTAASAKRPGTATTVAAATETALRPVGPAFARRAAVAAAASTPIAATPAPPQQIDVGRTCGCRSEQVAPPRRPCNRRSATRSVRRPPPLRALDAPPCGQAPPRRQSRPVFRFARAAFGRAGFTIRTSVATDTRRRRPRRNAACRAIPLPSAPPAAVPSARCARCGPTAHRAGAADIVGSIEIPPEVNASANAIDTGTLAKLVEEKRRADAGGPTRRRLLP